MGDLRTEPRIYFRQLLAGRDYAVHDEVARQMANFVYLVGDRETGEALIIDPAYDIEGLVEVIEADDMTLRGVLVTHYHADHVGGSLMGYDIAGLAQLLEQRSVPVHVNAEELRWVSASTGVAPSELMGHADGDRVPVGAVEVELLHTPGHTPGSQCFMVDGMLISGDTLFLQGCGRTDLPGSDVDEMYSSLRRLAGLPAEVTVFPGHHYSPADSQSMGALRETNLALRPLERDEWRALFGL